MIQVTERAREQLKAVRDQVAEQPDVCLRLGPVAEGQLGVFPDTGTETDQVVEHDGTVVLLVDPKVAAAIDGTTIDLEESDEGTRLTLRR